MRRMKTEWELVNHGEVQEDSSILLDHEFQLLEGEYFIYYDDMNNDLTGQSTFIVTKEAVDTAKLWDDLILNLVLGNQLTLNIEFDSKKLFYTYMAAGQASVISGAVYIYKKS